MRKKANKNNDEQAHEDVLFIELSQMYGIDCILFIEHRDYIHKDNAYSDFCSNILDEGVWFW
jgi:hypothetical protein